MTKTSLLAWWFQSVSLHGFQRKLFYVLVCGHGVNRFQSVSLHGFQRKSRFAAIRPSIFQVSIRLTSRIPEKEQMLLQRQLNHWCFNPSHFTDSRERATAQLWAGSRVWVSIRLTSRIPEKEFQIVVDAEANVGFNPSHFTDSRERTAPRRPPICNGSFNPSHFTDSRESSKRLNLLRFPLRFNPSHFTDSRESFNVGVNPATSPVGFNPSHFTDSRESPRRETAQALF